MPKTKDYQALSLELDDVLAALQQPGIQVDEAVKLYDKGLQLIVQLEKHLDEAENMIQKLTLAAGKVKKDM
jgi:exodeoxyribonuclease VII small subunit